MISSIRDNPNVAAFLFKLKASLVSQTKVLEYISFYYTLIDAGENDYTAIEKIRDKTLDYYPYKKDITIGNFNFSAIYNPINWHKNILSQALYEKFNASSQPILQLEIAKFCNDDMRIMLESTVGAKVNVFKLAEKTIKNAGNQQKKLLLALGSPFATTIALIQTMKWFNGNLTEKFLTIKEIPDSRVILLDNIEKGVIGVEFYIYLALICLYVFYVSVLPKATGKLRLSLEKTPLVSMPFTIYKLRQSSSLLNTLNILYKSGVDTSKALNRIHDNSNRYMRWRCEEIIERFELLGTESQAYKTDLFLKEVSFQLAMFLSSPKGMEKLDVVLERVDAVVEKKFNQIIMVVPFIISLLAFSYIGILSIAMLVGVKVE